MPENFLSPEDRPTVAFIAVCTLVAAFLIVSAMYWFAGDNGEEGAGSQLAVPAETVAEEPATTTGAAAREAPKEALKPTHAH